MTAIRNRRQFDFNEKLAFLAEWYDYEASFVKKFVMLYFPSDHSAELHDTDLNRIFFKRSKIGEVCPDDIFVGNTIMIYGRQIHIMDYADCKTKEIVGNKNDITFTIVKPYAVDRIGEIILEIRNRHWKIIKLRMCNLKRMEVLALYASVKAKGDTILPLVLEELVSGPSIAMVIMGENAVERWLEELGPRDVIEAKRVAPNSLRAIFGGASRALNGFHSALTHEQVIRESNFFFPLDKNQPVPELPLKISNTTCCIVKPHVPKAKKTGPILTAIKEAHFKIHALQLFNLTSTTAEEFLEVYKGVVSDFRSFVDSFLDGPCLVLEIAGENDEINVHQEFRKFCGPPDPDMARQIRPKTLRARFGLDKYRNAVHCTDLPEDTVLELEYFFRILKR